MLELKKPDLKKYEKLQDERLANEFAGKLIEMFYDPKLKEHGNEVTNAIKSVLEKIDKDDKQFADLVRGVIKTKYSKINEKYKILE